MTTMVTFAFYSQFHTRRGETMILKSISVRSAAKLAAVMYALIALSFGAIIILLALLGVPIQEGTEEPNVLLAVGIAFFLPIFYAPVGYIATAIVTALFNKVAGWTGGLEMDLEIHGSTQSPQEE